MSLSPGDRFGPYEILEKIGQGGMGEVHKARDTRLDRTVALKFLPSHVAGDPELRQRFDREARAISSLNHPRICTLHDIGHQDGVDYLVMEYLEGETLAERLKRGPVPTDELLAIAVQIADALDSAHRRGMVHRDLKPGNVMLTREGAKLLDFGLAKLQAEVEPPSDDALGGATLSTPLTRQGTIVGTLQFMAPEQLVGKEADARSDIFALGTVLYQMATGVPAFTGASQASLIASILKEQPRPISEVQPVAPPMLDRAVKQCLAKDPDERWQTAGDLKRALQWIAEGGSAAGVPVPVSRRRRTRERSLAVAVAVLAVAVAGVGWLYQRTVSVKPEVVASHLLALPGTEYVNWAGGHFAISPDGRKLAFVAEDSSSGAPRLWVRRLDSLAALPLPGTENAGFPFWSPDSKYIGFFAQGKLKKILAGGGPPLSLCDASTPRGAAGTATA